MNAYFRRKAAQLARAKERRSIRDMHKYMEVDRFLLQFEQAYMDVYGVKVKVQYKHGYYYMLNHAYRHSDLARMLATLQATAHEARFPTIE